MYACMYVYLCRTCAYDECVSIFYHVSKRSKEIEIKKATAGIHYEDFSTISTSLLSTTFDAPS